MTHFVAKFVKYLFWKTFRAKFYGCADPLSQGKGTRSVKTSGPLRDQGRQVVQREHLEGQVPENELWILKIAPDKSEILNLNDRLLEAMVYWCLNEL